MLSSPHRRSQSPSREPSSARFACSNLLLCLLLGLSAVTLHGCKIDAQGLAELEAGPDGYERLATYALDISRPDKLRRSALRTLARERKYDELLTVVGQTSLLKDDSVEQMAFLAKVLLEYAGEVASAEKSPEMKSQVAELCYLILSFQAVRTEIASRDKLLNHLTEWSLSHLRVERKVITPIKAKSFYTTPHNLLVSLLLSAQREDGSNQVFDLVSSDLKTHLKKVDYMLRIHKVVHEVRIPEVTEGFTPILYLMARDLHANHPDKMNRAVINALLENRNLTTLKFLVEICRDQRLSSKLLEFTLDEVMKITQAQQYQSEIVPILQRVISSEHAHLRVSFVSLEWAWLLGKQNNLRDLLVSIPATLKLPVSGTQMKQSVDRFCTVVLDQSKDLVRSILQELIIDLRERAELWPARLIAVSCVERLYPDDFRKLMNRDQLYRRHYQGDPHPISAWRSDRVVKLGEIIAQYMNPRR